MTLRTEAVARGDGSSTSSTGVLAQAVDPGHVATDDLVRLAQVPPVGFVIDLVLGRYAADVVGFTRRLVDDRVRALTGR